MSKLISNVDQYNGVLGFFNDLKKYKTLKCVNSIVYIIGILNNLKKEYEQSKLQLKLLNDRIKQNQTSNTNTISMDERISKLIKVFQILKISFSNNLDTVSSIADLIKFTGDDDLKYSTLKEMWDLFTFMLYTLQQDDWDLSRDDKYLIVSISFSMLYLELFKINQVKFTPHFHAFVYHIPQWDKMLSFSIGG
ncbi:hypothetical protein ACTFIW_008869 [Dictyostelium discoideum]